jgi:hypothetical protein
LKVAYEGVTIYKEWIDKGSYLFRMNLNNTGGNRITPPVDPVEYSTEFNSKSDTTCQSLNWSTNNLCNCKTIEQLIKYYNVSLGLHQKQTLVTATQAEYLHR